MIVKPSCRNWYKFKSKKSILVWHGSNRLEHILFRYIGRCPFMLFIAILCSLSTTAPPSVKRRPENCPSQFQSWTIPTKEWIKNIIFSLAVSFPVKKCSKVKMTYLLIFGLLVSEGRSKRLYFYLDVFFCSRTRQYRRYSSNKFQMFDDSLVLWDKHLKINPKSVWK